MDPFFDRAFWQQFVVTFFSIVAGIPAGLWLTRWGHRQEKAHQEQEEAERRHQLLLGLKASVGRNHHLLDLFVNDEQGHILLMDHLDLTFFDATAGIKYEVLRDVGLASDVDAFRAWLREIELGITTYNQLSLELARGAENKEKLRELIAHMREGVKQRVPACMAIGEALLKKIDEALVPAEMREPRREAAPPLR